MIHFCVLGTAAGGAPTLERAPAAVVVRIEGEVFLFDCGEGTQRQLIRAGISRRKLGLIAITHLHGDHVLGLVPLLASMSSDRRREPLLVIGPPGLGELVWTTLRLIDVQLSFELEVRELAPKTAGTVLETGRWTLRYAAVEHTVPSFSFRLEERRPPVFDMERVRALGLRPGRLLGELKRHGEVTLPDGRVVRLHEVAHHQPQPSLVYCGDTQPCDADIELARGADVLLHEATFSEEHGELARRTLHSTAADAATVAAQAGVGELLLLHFSTRYDTLEPLLYEARRIFPRTRLARELRWEAIPTPREVVESPSLGTA
ncbi:Ribonuclease BN [bacterium HR21]|nr:Ribonuclease BN [bacterium HR21]